MPIWLLPVLISAGETLLVAVGLKIVDAIFED